MLMGTLVLALEHKQSVSLQHLFVAALVSYGETGW